MNLEITFVIVTHNHAKYIDQCLVSCVQSLRIVHGEIIVVDNCSTDGTMQILNKYSDSISLIPNTVRIGFSANNNKAIKQAQGRYVFILNPDTSFSPNIVRGLIDLANTVPNLGLIAPHLIYPDGSIQPSCRRFPTIGSFLVRRTPLRLLLKDTMLNRKHLMFDKFKQGEIKVDWVLGACMLIPKVVFDKIGLFDERFYLYVEDIDLCYRMYQAGLDVVYTSKYKIVHHHLAESDWKLFGIRSWYHFHSMIQFVLKYKLNYNYFG